MDTGSVELLELNLVAHLVDRSVDRSVFLWAEHSAVHLVARLAASKEVLWAESLVEC